MSKPLAGARWFEAQGRRAFTQGRSISWERSQRNHWPMWARSAWARGWIQQGNGRQLTEMIVQSFEDEAQRTGTSLRETVNHYYDGPGGYACGGCGGSGKERFKPAAHRPQETRNE